MAEDWIPTFVGMTEWEKRDCRVTSLLAMTEKVGEVLLFVIINCKM